MLGLVFLVIVALYLAISALAVWLATRWAKKHNRKAWLWGGIAAFVMYNLVFWDLIPTLIAHKYYCATQSGFWVYKTPEEWNAENPGVMEILKESLSPNRVTYRQFGRSLEENLPSNIQRSWYNQRFFQDTNRELIFLSLGRTEKKFYDAETSKIIARGVNFILGSGMGSFVSGGSLEAWRRTFVFGWFTTRQCSVSGKSSIDGVSPIDLEYSQFIYQFWKLGEGK